MRHVALVVAAAGFFLVSPAHAAYEFYVKVKGAARDAPSGPILLKVETSRDDDGDGKPDEGLLRIVCAANEVRSASFHYNVKSPRDSASGMASGKRTHHPVTFVKEWGPSTPQFFQASLKTLVTAKEEPRSALGAGWVPVTLSNTAGLCAAATASLVKAGSTSKHRKSHDVHELEKISRKK
jgi:hypothetical protein